MIETTGKNMDKITVHTPHGDVSIGDECEGLRDDRFIKGKLDRIDANQIASFPYRICYVKKNQKVELWCEAIRPIQKPKPLDGVELYEKFVELMDIGWIWSDGDKYIAKIISVFICKDMRIEINGFKIDTLLIRPPRSTEWIRACDVTEETGR